MRRIGVLLSGCGVKDGSEIHEATLTLYFLDRLGVERICCAPDAAQTAVSDHRSGRDTQETRNILVEAARIARGEIQPLANMSADDLDGLIIPGGMGAARNLCTYAAEGRGMNVREDVASLIKALHTAGKPIGAICIAPVVVAKALGDVGVEAKLTIGDDPDVGADINAWGAQHVIHLVDEIHQDKGNRLVSTPAYMLGRNVAEIAPGIEKLVETVVKWA